jgi:hypothetical protein
MFLVYQESDRYPSFASCFIVYNYLEMEKNKKFFRASFQSMKRYQESHKIVNYCCEFKTGPMYC